MFPRRCPSCSAELVGRPFDAKGRCTWDAIMKSMVRSGQMTAAVPPPPGMRKCYFVGLTCVCGKQIGDFPIMLEDGYLPWTQIVKRYEASDVLTEDMVWPEK